MFYYRELKSESSIQTSLQDLRKRVNSGHLDKETAADLTSLIELIETSNHRKRKLIIAKIDRQNKDAARSTFTGAT